MSRLPLVGHTVAIGIGQRVGTGQLRPCVPCGGSTSGLVVILRIDKTLAQTAARSRSQSVACVVDDLIVEGVTVK